MKIKVAIFGAGRWGSHLIRNFCELPGSEVIAVVDPHPERLAGVKARFNLSSAVILATDDIPLWDLPQLDAVVIATPASTHYHLVKRALERGCHVFAEKPLTLESEQADQLFQLAHRQQRHLFVDHTYLFHPAIVAGKVLIEQGRLGEFRYGYAARTHLEPIRYDVDVLWDLAIHDLVIFRTWLGQSPIQVQAQGAGWLSSGEKTDVDLVMATITYPQGFQAFLHFCWLNPDKQRRLSLVGSEGTLIFDELSSLSPLILQPGNVALRDDQRWCATHAPAISIPITSVEPLKQVCNHFLQLIQTPTSGSFSPDQLTLELISILEGLSQSLQRGGVPVRLRSESR